MLGITFFSTHSQLFPVEMIYRMGSFYLHALEGIAKAELNLGN